jgi:hypothetical protein
MRSAALIAITLSSAPAVAGFRMQEIGTGLDVVYAVNVADMNRDGKPDVVAINNTTAMWFENPSWKKHVVFDGPASGHPFWKKDNVTFAVEDVDGDGWPEMALGADWQPSNTNGGGSIQWLQRKDKKNHDAPWILHPISTEPTVHRMRWADVDGDGKRELVVKVLHERGAKGPGWDGPTGLRVLVFRKPKDPVGDPWLVEVADQSLHIGHNFFVDSSGKPDTLVIASKEGLHRLARDKGGRWSRTKVGDGAPGEVKPGKAAGARYMAAIEPWHGTKLLAYKEPAGGGLWTHEVLDDKLTEGHGIGWGDFDGDGSDEIVAGWRKKPFGVAVYKRDPAGRWGKTMIDDGMATEDITVADLDGNGRPDVVAGGRLTANIRIYFSEK